MRRNSPVVCCVGFVCVYFCALNALCRHYSCIQSVIRIGAPGSQGGSDPRTDRSIRLPGGPCEPVLRKQQVQGSTGSGHRIPGIEVLHDQGGCIIQRFRKNGQQLIVRHRSRQFCLHAENIPVGYHQIIQPILIRRHMNAGAINIRGEITHESFSYKL